MCRGCAWLALCAGCAWLLDAVEGTLLCVAACVASGGWPCLLLDACAGVGAAWSGVCFLVLLCCAHTWLILPVGYAYLKD